MTIVNDALYGWLDLLFLKTAFGGGFLIDAGTVTDFYISGHTADPAPFGTNQTQFEATYTGYGRAAIPRDGTGWVRNLATTRNAAAFDLGQNTGGTTEVLTFLGIGTVISGAGYMFNSWRLQEPIVVIPGFTPQWLQQEVAVLIVGF